MELAIAALDATLRLGTDDIFECAGSREGAGFVCRSPARTSTAARGSDRRGRGSWNARRVELM